MIVYVFLVFRQEHILMILTNLKILEIKRLKIIILVTYIKKKNLKNQLQNILINLFMLNMIIIFIKYQQIVFFISIKILFRKVLYSVNILYNINYLLYSFIFYKFIIP